MRQCTCWNYDSEENNISLTGGGGVDGLSLAHLPGKAVTPCTLCFYFVTSPSPFASRQKIHYQDQISTNIMY